MARDRLETVDDVLARVRADMRKDYSVVHRFTFCSYLFVNATKAIEICTEGAQPELRAAGFLQCIAKVAMIRPLHDCAGSSELDIPGADLFGYRVVPRAGQGKAEFGLIKLPEKLSEAAT